jgi:hypothetical protein
MGAFQRTWALARTSLFSVGMSSLLTGCLVAEPPNPSNPERTPPMIDFRNTFPLVTQITSVSGFQDFSVGFRSEDRGDKIVGILYRNFTLDGEKFEATTERPASTFDDTDRTITIRWNVPRPEDLAGCQQVTMLVTHRENVNFSTPPEVISPADVALAAWWLHVNPNPERPNDFGVCPKPSATQ